MRISWSLRSRLTAWYAALLATSLLIFGVALYALFARSLWTHAQEILRMRAEQLASFVEASDAGNEQGTFFDLADPSVVERFATGGVMIQINDTRGHAVNRSAGLPVQGVAPQAAVDRALGGQASFSRVAPAGMDPLLVYTAPITHRATLIGTVQVATSLDPVTEPLVRLLWLLLAGGGAALVVAVGVGYLLASVALAPVDRITRTARAIGAGAVDQRLHLAGRPDDELWRLGRAFDEMLDRLAEALDRERRFTADAAHELRTPLSILKGELEVALRRERPATAYREALQSMAQEVDRLTRLTEDLLTLARADAGSVPIEHRPVPVGELARWAQEQFTGAAQKKRITLEIIGEDSLSVRGDADRLRQLLTILLDNAITYTPEGGRVRVTWERNGASARVAVVDTGHGIAPEDLPHVLDRFYRADRARVRTSGGSGLGLAIAEWIVKAHGGHIQVESQLGAGTTVTVWLALADGS